MVFSSCWIWEMPSSQESSLDAMPFCVGALAWPGPDRNELFAHNYCVVDFALRGSIVGCLYSSLAFNMLREATRPLIKCRECRRLVFKAVRLRTNYNYVSDSPACTPSISDGGAFRLLDTAGGPVING